MLSLESDDNSNELVSATERRLQVDDFAAIAIKRTNHSVIAILHTLLGFKNMLSIIIRSKKLKNKKKIKNNIKEFRRRKKN